MPARLSRKGKEPFKALLAATLRGKACKSGGQRRAQPRLLTGWAPCEVTARNSDTEPWQRRKVSHAEQRDSSASLTLPHPVGADQKEEIKTEHFLARVPAESLCLCRWAPVACCAMGSQDMPSARP